ncbi:MAG: biotin/lipoyl-binding protein, partial [Clostridia bacterium]|nr:biotin/lipoyl-binding protein [Clostridia bacterium]
PVESQIEIAPQKTSSDGNTINAPLPGSIVAIKVAVGQSVKKGQVVALLEAMKMENEIVSPDDGIIKTILAPKGSNVVVGDPIIELG